MEQANWFIIPISALIPLVISFIWYQPNVLGNRLVDAADNDVVQLSAKRSIGKTVLIYVFSLLLSYILTIMSVHQIGVFQLFFMDPALADATSEYATFINDFMVKYSERHRSFGHGVIHGAEASLFWGLAFFGISAFMEGKSLKRNLVHLGFFVVCCSLMAGLNCAFF